MYLYLAVLICIFKKNGGDLLKKLSLLRLQHGTQMASMAVAHDVGIMLMVSPTLLECKTETGGGYTNGTQREADTPVRSIRLE